MTSKTSQAHLEDIAHSLASLAFSIRISNHGYGFYNINKYSEDCLAKVLAIVHDTEFQVLEYRQVNAVAIDIASEDNQWAYQITSQGTALKLKETILKFLKGGLQNKYKTLRFLILKEKYNPRISNEAISDFLKKKDKQLPQIFNKMRANKRVFDIKSMVFDLTGLANLIKEHCDNQQLEQIAELLKVEYGFFTQRESISRLAAFDDYIESANDQLEKLSPMDALVEIPKLFHPIVFYPKFLLLRLYPLSKGNYSAHYRDFSVRTDHKELVEELKSHEETQENDELPSIGKFFIRNYVYNIKYSRDSSVDFFKYHDQDFCKCERCSFNRFEFQQSFIKLSAKTPRPSAEKEYESLRSAYTAYLFGDFHRAFTILTQLSEVSIENKDHVSHFLCEYNLSNMGRSLEINCPTKSKIAECRLRTERIKTDLLVSSYYGKGADKEVIDLLRWIEESRFLDATIVKMMDTLEGVRSEHHNDKKGRLQRKLFDADLLDSLIKSIGFANSNLLIINKFANYQRLVRLIFETYLLKNDMFDVDNQRIEPNADFFIEHFILAGKPSDFKSIIKKHEILDSPYYKKNEDVIPPFISRMKNLVDNLGFLNDYIGEREDDLTPNYHLKFKINDYVANSIYISTAFDIHADHLNTFYLYLLTFFKKFNFLNFKSAEALSFGINHKLGMLPTTTKKELFSLRDIGSRLLQQNLVVDLFLSDDDFTIQRTAQGAADFDQMINAPGEEQASLCINLFYQIAFLNEKTRKAFADKVVSLLEEKFKVVLAYFAVQEGMMNFTEYLPVFIKHVKVSVDKEFGKRQQYPHRYIEDLNLFLSLLFEHNIDLSRQEIKALNPGSDYYNWLFDMDQFDYSNFDPFWILRFRSDGFIAKYRSSPNLIAAIKNSLKDKYNSAVGEFFVQKIL